MEWIQSLAGKLVEVESAKEYDIFELVLCFLPKQLEAAVNSKLGGADCYLEAGRLGYPFAHATFWLHPTIAEELLALEELSPVHFNKRRVLVALDLKPHREPCYQEMVAIKIGDRWFESYR